MTDRQLKRVTWILLVFMMVTTIAVKCAPRESPKPNEDVEGLQFVFEPLPTYVFKDGSTCSLERNPFTGEVGVLKPN